MEENKKIIEDYTVEYKGSIVLSWRFLIAMFIMLGFIVSFAFRINMSTGVVCMINHTALCIEESRSEEPVQWRNTSIEDVSMLQSLSRLRCQNVSSQVPDGEIIWNKETQGLVLASIYYGYLVSQMPASWLTQRYGAKRTVAWFMGIATLAEFLTPLAAQLGYIPTIIIRAILGAGLGAVVPGGIALIANWAPSLERTRLIGICLAGSSFANVITFPTCSVLCEYGFAGGWPSMFYVFGICTFVWLVLWLLLVSDSPENHPFISARERRYIIEHRDGLSQIQRKTQFRQTPWFKIFTSGPVWAITMTNTSFCWGLYTMMNDAPTYMYEDLKVGIQLNGVLTSMSFIGYGLMSMISPIGIDYLRSKSIMSTTNVRKLCVAIGCIAPAMFMTGVGFVTSSHALVAAVLLALGLLIAGVAPPTFVSNIIDIAPRYPAPIAGFSNTIGTIPGVLGPTVVAAMTINYLLTRLCLNYTHGPLQQTHEEWQSVFFLTSVIFVLGAIFYCLLGTAETQTWAIDSTVVDETTYMLHKQRAKDESE